MGDDDDDSVCVSVCNQWLFNTLQVRRGRFRASQERKNKKILITAEKMKREKKKKGEEKEERCVQFGGGGFDKVSLFFFPLHHLVLSRLLVSLFLFFPSFHPLPIFDKCSNRHPRLRQSAV